MSARIRAFLGIRDDDLGVDGIIVAATQSNLRGALFKTPHSHKIPLGSEAARISSRAAEHELAEQAGHVVSGQHEDSTGYEGMRKPLGVWPRPAGVILLQRSGGRGRDQSSTLIGQNAADLLVECIEAGKPLSARRTLIAPRLIARESSNRK